MAEAPETEEESKKEELLLALLFLHTTMGRVWKRSAVQPANRVFDAQLGKMLTFLHKFLGKRTRQFLAPRELAAIYRTITTVTPKLAQPLAQVVGDVGRAVVPESAHAVDRLMAKMTGKDPGLSTPQGLLRPYAVQYKIGLEELVDQVQKSLAHDIAQGIVSRLKQVAINDVKGADILAEAGAAMEDMRWKVERVVRTEAARAFNSTQQTAILLLSEEFPTMRKRWTELVDEATGRPMDSRVAKDSMVLHGQIADASRPIIMPQDSRAPTDMVGKSWQFPPNRPNDRAVLVPWMPGWPVSVYRVEGTSRVSVDYRTGKPR